MRYIFFIPCLIVDFATIILISIPFRIICEIEVKSSGCSDIIFKKQKNKYNPDEWDVGWLRED